MYVQKKRVTVTNCIDDLKFYYHKCGYTDYLVQL